MKHRKIVIALILAFSLALTLAACGGSNAPPASTSPPPGGTSTPSAPPASTPPAKPDKVYDLTLAHHFPANGDMEQNHITRWIAEIEEATNGQIKITSYPGNTLTSATENYEGVVQAISDIGICNYGNAAGRFPIIEAFMMPGVTNFLNAPSAGYAVTDFVSTHKPAELSDTKPLFSFSTGPNVLMTNKAVRSLEDLKGLPLAATQAERVKALELLGATPIAVLTPDWYESISKGLVDGGIMSIEALKSRRLAEVTGSYIVDIPLFSNTMFYCVMNLDVYNSLPPDCQEAITRVPDYFMEAYDIQVLAAMEYAKTEREVEIVYLSDEELNRWKERLTPMKEDNVQTLNSRGLDGKEIQKIIAEFEAKYNALYPHSQL